MLIFFVYPYILCSNIAYLLFSAYMHTYIQISDTLNQRIRSHNVHCDGRMFTLLLQLADLTGELMRLAIGRISDGEVEYSERICQFVRDIYRELTLLVPLMDDGSDMKTKMDTMLQSVVKIENACFSVRVRGSEYIPLLGSSDPSSFLVGVSDGEL